MTENKILEHIWSDAIELRASDRMSPLARILDAVVNIPTITLVSHLGNSHPVVFMESTELAFGATLGDILAEELGVQVPKGAVVLIESAEFADSKEYSGTELGQVLGNILLGLAGESGVRPFGENIEARDDNIKSRSGSRIRRLRLKSEMQQRPLHDQHHYPI